MHKTLVALALILSISSAALTDTAFTAVPNSATAGYVITGAGSGGSSEKIGRYIADLGGDFNGDTFRDYVVAGDGVNVYVVLGSATGRSDVLALSGTPSSTTFIKIVLPANSVVKALATGDLNGDDIPDIAIGVPAAAGAGRVYVVYGKSTKTWTGQAGQPVTITVADDDTLELEKGFTVKILGTTQVSLAIGDFLADTKRDLVIGTTEYNSGQTANEGAVCVVYGKEAETTAATATSQTKRGNTIVDCTSAAGLKEIAAVQGGAAAVPLLDGKLYKGASGDKIGLAVAAGSDISGDGNEDLFVSSANSANCYLIYGEANIQQSATADQPNIDDISALADNAKGIKITQAGNGAVTVASYIGNWNGDSNGKAELALGAPTDASNKGRVYIIFGQATTKVTETITLGATGMKTYGIAITGKTDEAFGTSLDNAGDVDGSGTVDLIVGAPTTGGDNALQVAGVKGKAYIIYGSAANTASVDLTTTPLTSTTGVVYTGLEKTGFGLAVSGAGGSLNGDSYADFLVGAPFATKVGTPADIIGNVYELRGQAQDPTPTNKSGFRLHASLLVLASFFIALMF